MTSVFGKARLTCATFALMLGAIHALPAAGQSNDRVLATYRRGQNATATASAANTRIDRQIQPAAHTQATTQTAPQRSQDRRLLAPPSIQKSAATQLPPQASKPRTPSFALPKIESFSTAGAGLAIVVGLFLVCMWLLRRSGPRPTAPLPNEVVAVLGRIPLAARNFAHLLRVGNKLVLVAMTPEGVAPITEINDPVEVQRLLGLCLKTQKASTSAEFHDVLKNLAKEPASGFLGNEVATAYKTQGR